MIAKIATETQYRIELPDHITVAGMQSTIEFDNYARNFICYTENSEKPRWSVMVELHGWRGKTEVCGSVICHHYDVDEEDDYPDAQTEVYCKDVPVEDVPKAIEDAIKAIENEKDSVLND